MTIPLTSELDDIFVQPRSLTSICLSFVCLMSIESSCVASTLAPDIPDRIRKSFHSIELIDWVNRADDLASWTNRIQFLITCGSKTQQPIRTLEFPFMIINFLKNYCFLSHFFFFFENIWFIGVCVPKREVKKFWTLLIGRFRADESNGGWSLAVWGGGNDAQLFLSMSYPMCCGSKWRPRSMAAILECVDGVDGVDRWT